MSDTEQTQTDAPAPAVARKVRTPGKAVVEQVAPQAVALPSDDTPNAIDIDPKAITSPVLTRQGWVCPDMADSPTLGPR